MTVLIRDDQTRNGIHLGFGLTWSRRVLSQITIALLHSSRIWTSKESITFPSSRSLCVLNRLT